MDGHVKSPAAHKRKKSGEQVRACARMCPRAGVSRVCRRATTAVEGTTSRTRAASALSARRTRLHRTTAPGTRGRTCAPLQQARAPPSHRGRSGTATSLELTVGTTDLHRYLGHRRRHRSRCRERDLRQGDARTRSTAPGSVRAPRGKRGHAGACQARSSAPGAQARKPRTIGFCF